MKINLKNSLIILGIIILLLVIPTFVSASDTFTTSNGITVKKIVTGFSNGSITLDITNIPLSPEGNYKWGIGKSKSANDITKWYVLGDINASKKAASVNLTVQDKDILALLRSTNTAYLFVKDSTNEETLIIDGLELDLTLPPLYAFDYMENNGNYYIIGGNLNNINKWKGATYNIKNAYYKFEKITDENLVNKYKKSLLDGSSLSSVFSITESTVESKEGWTACSRDYDYSFTRIDKTKLPTDQGAYYLWVKAKDVDSKTVYGCLIVNVDADGPTVKKIQVISPNSGTYKTNQTVKICVCFSEPIRGTSVPTLKIKFGESAERIVTNGTISGSYIIYSYNIQDSDKGQLATVSLSGGTIKDATGNVAILSCPLISGNTIKANTEGTTTNNIQNQDTTNNTQNQDTKQYVSFPMLIVNGKASLSVKNYDGDYKLYYQFIEVNDTQMKKIEELQEKYKKSEISYSEFANQYKQILPAYDETKWTETADGKFENDLSKFTGTKKFALWAKLVMKDKTVYEANVYTMKGNGETSNNTSQTPDANQTPNTNNNGTTNNNNDTSNKKDDTTAPTKIPQTGENIIIIATCALIIGLGAFAYIKYNKYRDIK